MLPNIFFLYFYLFAYFLSQLHPMLRCMLTVGSLSKLCISLIEIAIATSNSVLET